MVEEIQKKQTFLQRTGAAIGGAAARTGGALERTWVALQSTGGALERTGGAMERTGVALQRTGGAIERSRHVLTLEPAAAHTAGPLITRPRLSKQPQLSNCSKGALTPNWDDVRTYVRACVRASHSKILFNPYLVVELSPSAEFWCVYVTSTNDGTQILTFLGIDNNRDFQNSRFFCGDLFF